MAWDGIKDYGFGTRPKEVDDKYRAMSHKKRVWTKEKCIKELEELLDILKRILKEDAKLEVDSPRKLKQETVRDAITMMNKILDVMKYLYPPIVQSVNVNIDMTAEKVIDRIKEFKEKQVVVFGEKNGKDN